MKTLDKIRAELDDPAILARLDTQNMFRALIDFPDQCSNAMMTRVGLPIGYSRIQNIIVTGMGASGIGGDLVRALLGSRVEVPIVVNKGYDLPAFVDNRTLLIVVSYSGDTEETISACSAGLTHGAKVVIVTTDGVLERIARDTGLPLVSIPKGLQPRAALAYLFFPLVAVFRAAELTDGLDGEGELVALLSEKRHSYKPETALDFNPAKQLAAALYGKVPVVWGADELSGVAALRWKGQFNESGKTLAFNNYFPELNHNEIAGLAHPADLLDRLHLVLLRDRQDHPQILNKMERARRLLGNELGGISEVWAEGHAEITRVFSLIYMGDYVSLYLALLNGVDPSGNERTDAMKEMPE